jgi:hypothetical protein
MTMSCLSQLTKLTNFDALKYGMHLPTAKGTIAASSDPLDIVAAITFEVIRDELKVPVEFQVVRKAPYPVVIGTNSLNDLGFGLFDQLKGEEIEFKPLKLREAGEEVTAPFSGSVKINEQVNIPTAISKNTKLNPCFGCGELHWRSTCPHRSSKCRRCQKFGHLAKVCKSLKSYNEPSAGSFNLTKLKMHPLQPEFQNTTIRTKPLPRLRKASKILDRSATKSPVGRAHTPPRNYLSIPTMCYDHKYGKEESAHTPPLKGLLFYDFERWCSGRGCEYGKEVRLNVI